MELFDDITVAELSRCVLDKSAAESSNAGPYDITVVTVVLNAIDGNRSRRLHQCLDSVQKQKNVRVEHLIVDGASKDGTTEMLRAYKNRNVDIRLLSKPDAGIYDAMNRGIALAHGKYVIFLNSDDYYQDPLGLACAFAQLERTGCDFSFAPARVLSEENDKPIDHPYVHPRTGNIFVKMAFSHQSMMVRRDVLLSINGFDTHYKSAADYDSVLRLIFAGRSACCVSHSFVTFRMGGFSHVNMDKSQMETGVIFSKLYNQYAGANLTPSDGLQLHLSERFPAALKKRLFPYYVSAFGAGMLAAEMDDDAVPSELYGLLAFKHGLLPLKKGMGAWAFARCALPAVARHPIWFVEFIVRYRSALRVIGKKDAARMAFNGMGWRLYKRHRKSMFARMRARAAAVRIGTGSVAPPAPIDVYDALPPHVSIAPCDSWNVFGIYDVEPWGAWADREMSVKVRVPDDYAGGGLIASLAVGGYVFPESLKRTLSISVNSAALPSMELDHIEPRKHEFDIPDSVVGSTLLNFRFLLDADFVPAELGRSTDSRRLGIAFGGLKIRKKGNIR